MSVLDDICRREEKKIFLCHTMYHVLITLSIVLENIPYESCVIVVAPLRKPKDDFRNYFAMFERVRREGINIVLIDKGGIARRLFGISEIKNRKIFREVLNIIDCKKNEYLMINMSWNRQIVFYPASLYFKNCKNAIFIEEGAKQWLTPKINVIIICCLRIYGNQLNWWKDTKIDNVYAHDTEKLLELGVPLSKTKEFELDHVIQNYDMRKRRNLCSFFIDDRVLSEFNRYNEKQKCIVFTQPISEDSYVMENEKINIYSDICKYYSQYGQVYLKKHPRDNTEYEIDNVIVINDRFPSELFSILKLHFYIAVGLCTSAIEEVVADYKMNIGETFLSNRKYTLVSINELAGAN